MTPTPSAWTPDLVARHPQSASNMIGKLEADVARMQRELQEAVMLTLTYQTERDEAHDRADRAEAAIKRVTDEGMQRVIAAAIDRITDTDFEGYPRPLSSYTAANAALVAIRNTAATVPAEDVPA